VRDERAADVRPSPRFYEALIEALVAAPAAGVSPDAHRRAIAESAVFAAEQINALAAELRWPVMIGLAGFRTLIGLRHLRGFTRLPLADRRRILQAWAFGPIAITRQLFRPIRTTALVAYYEAVTAEPAT
jgi:hypothetical protein